jgi:hypothetical protein
MSTTFLFLLFVLIVVAAAFLLRIYPVFLNRIPTGCLVLLLIAGTVIIMFVVVLVILLVANASGSAPQSIHKTA